MFREEAVWSISTIKRKRRGGGSVRFWLVRIFKGLIFVNEIFFGGGQHGGMFWVLWLIPRFFCFFSFSLYNQGLIFSLFFFFFYLSTFPKSGYWYNNTTEAQLFNPITLPCFMQSNQVVNSGNELDFMPNLDLITIFSKAWQSC